MPEILPFDDPSKEACPNSIEVSTYPKPTDPNVTLANITHVFTGSHDATWRQLATAEPMDHEEAMQRAIAYAKEHDIPVIYESQSA